MKTYEKLGAFYLGRPVSDEEEAEGRGFLLYDSKDLTTHAVCVGMTGSGKTGLCISLLEEAALDGVPAIAIDPKGDLGNLLLTFPDLEGPSFEPWVNEEEARKQGLTVAEFADQQAQLWRNGLADWDQSGDRIRRLRDAAEFAIYTPGSQAGIPISILASFAAPPAQIVEDGDLFHDRIGTTATSLLTLLGIEADPIRSREHILLSTLLDSSWRQGRDLDLAGLIRAIQDPPVERVGVVDLETFYPANDRFEFAMRVNSLLAAPGFQSWLSGEPMDINRLLYTDQGKPRVAIISIAHLADSERMFFVSLLLNEILGWVRTQEGTSSLRALLYMDEIFGYMPPVAEPPSKRPLLTLLKQARAYGLGVVLATQNPVDLDYKGLSNTGTWFLGRLQTERDKKRVLDGLEGVSSDGQGFDRGRAEAVLAGLGKRVFWLHSVHESQPTIFRTRWAMSYLRGPLTRDQIRELTASDRRRIAAGPSPEADAAVKQQPSPGATPTPEEAAPDRGRPMVSPDVPQVFLPVLRYVSELTYRPALLGLASVHYTNRKRTREAEEEIALLLDLSSPTTAWAEAEQVGFGVTALEEEPPGPATFTQLPGSGVSQKLLGKYRKSLSEHLYRSRVYELLESPSLGELSRPGESERDFRIRLSERAREVRDREVDALRARYAKRIESLHDRIRTAEDKVEKESEQASSKRFDTAISMGATILSAFLGRKRLSSTTLSKAGTAAKGFGQSSKEAQDVRRAKEALENWQEKLEAMESELELEIEAMEERHDPLQETLETVSLRPRRTDVQIQLVALAWVPYEETEGRPVYLREVN